MLEVRIPGRGTLQLEHLVLDYNGTLACDGKLLDGVRKRLAALAEKLTVHVVTADTFGTARAELRGIPCQIRVLPEEGQDVAKAEYARRLGPSAVTVGNGRNDRLMLREAALGIAVVNEEGAAAEAIASAAVVCMGIRSALDLLLNPLRLVATLRS